MSLIIAVDSSINFCGISIFDMRVLKAESKLLHSQLLTPKVKSDEWIDKSMNIYEQIRSICLRSKGYYKLIIETPEYWGAAGYLARESGAVLKLMFLCGQLSTLNNSYIINPSTWKQQLPKEVVRNRLIKLYPKLDIKNMNHNVMDAIGIGHWFIHGKI